MNKENVAKWVAALRSGEYKQGQRALRYEDLTGETRHCCLGVLCELAGIEITNSQDKLPRAYPAAQWLGIETTTDNLENGVTVVGSLDGEPPTMHYLSGINDQGVSFERIADLIENADEIRI